MRRRRLGIEFHHDAEREPGGREAYFDSIGSDASKQATSYIPRHTGPRFCTITYTARIVVCVVVTRYPLAGSTLFLHLLVNLSRAPGDWAMGTSG